MEVRGVLVALLLGMWLTARASCAALRSEDVKFIKCQVCELLAKNAYKQVREMKKKATPAAPVTESLVIERIERIGDPLKDEGEWVASVDLVEEGSRLTVKEMGELGACEVECQTVEKAARLVLDEHDTDMAEVLFLGKKTRSQFTNWLCYELTNACAKEPPPLPKGRTPGPEFKPADPEQRKYDRLLAEGSTAIPRPLDMSLDTEDMDEEEMSPQQKAEAAVRRLDSLARERAKHDPSHPLHKLEGEQRQREAELRRQRRAEARRVHQRAAGDEL